MAFLGDRLVSAEGAGRRDPDELLMDWIGRQQSGSWLLSAVVLGAALVAIVLFAVIR